MFRLFGFDVHVRTGFLIFVGLIVFLYQSAFGIWLAGGIAVFTLLHELGHAVAARSAGAHAEISLDFLAGYTSFRPGDRPIGRGHRALISAAGPFTQIAASVVVLSFMGVNAFSLDSVRAASDAAVAIWWAGPAIGALNLIPVLPLDGGHLAMTGLEGVIGDRAMRVMAIASVTVTAGGAVLMAATGRAGFAIFIAFLLINQVQILQATSKRGRRHPVQRSIDAEAQAWQSGRPGMLEPGQRISPWFEAHQALSSGDAGGAMGVVLADLRSDKVPRWTPPWAASPEQLRAIVDVLPASLPEPGNEHSAAVLAEILLATGEPQRAGEFAASSFAASRSPRLALVVARASAATGQPDNALRWLSAAVDATAAAGPAARTLVGRTMDGAPELAALRYDPTFVALRHRVA